MIDEVELLTARAQLRTRILRCTRCPLFRTTRSPVPFSGPMPARIAVIAEAPGGFEEKEGKPLVGPSGQLLRRCLRNAGIDDTDVLYANRVQCRPKDNRDPLPAELSACRMNMWEPIALAQPSIIILAGRFAYSLLGDTGLTITRAHGIPHWVEQGDEVDGRIIHWGNVTFYPIAHPAFAMKSDRGRSDLMEAIKLMEARCHPSSDLWPSTCVNCGAEEVELYDRYGLPRCSSHLGTQETLGLGI